MNKSLFQVIFELTLEGFKVEFDQAYGKDQVRCVISNNIHGQHITSTTILSKYSSEIGIVSAIENTAEFVRKRSKELSRSFPSL